MNKLTFGILAHVDAGKTTLSEAILYYTGEIRHFGRVDKGDAFLDTDELERERGITIFSKQALFPLGKNLITLLDTPGHVDFSAEMERTLKVLDYAILVLSASEGVQAHTKTLWNLLDIYNIPVFVFINKMDMKVKDEDELIRELEDNLSGAFVNFNLSRDDAFYENLALSHDSLMEEYLDKGTIDKKAIRRAIKNRKLFPSFFGSALKLEGVEAFLEGIKELVLPQSYGDEFSARVFKITRDINGERLTHMKITGGSLKVRDLVDEEDLDEKINQIRIYSGERYESFDEAIKGTICAVTGLQKSKAGQVYGRGKTLQDPILEPFLRYRILLPEDISPRAIMPKLKELEEEIPELNISWNEEKRDIEAQVMGDIQIEILERIIEDRFDMRVGFDSGSIIYKETIENTVEGVGHFEPLRHYAEVHVLMEPGPRGSGLKFHNLLSDDILGRNYQNLIMGYLREGNHIGVLTGSSITDMKLSLVNGMAHRKHTQGGDFREATFRAIRQGLMEAKSILLEPFYSYSLELPEDALGRALTDLGNMEASSEIVNSRGGWAIIEGFAPAVKIRNYHRELISYTRGEGRISLKSEGYRPCHNQDEIINFFAYNPEKDRRNPTGSVFCEGGAGFSVSWDRVKDFMHLESYFKYDDRASQDDNKIRRISPKDDVISLDEIDEIIRRTYYSNQGKRGLWKKRRTARESYYKSDRSKSFEPDKRKEYLLVDGYNIIYAWPELKIFVDGNLDAAREKLLDTLSNYRAISDRDIIVVFDAYRVKGSREGILDYNNISLVYTGEAQTADQYIERFVHDHKKDYRITVATSDYLEQIIIRGRGASLLSATELKDEIKRIYETVIEEYIEGQIEKPNFIGDLLFDGVRDDLLKLLEGPIDEKDIDIEGRK